MVPVPVPPAAVVVVVVLSFLCLLHQRSRVFRRVCLCSGGPAGVEASRKHRNKHTTPAMPVIVLSP